MRIVRKRPFLFSALAVLLLLAGLFWRPIVDFVTVAYVALMNDQFWGSP